MSLSDTQTKCGPTMVHGTIQIDHSRDEKLTHFGKKTLENQYLQKGETYQTLFSRAAQAFADDVDHAQRMYDYMSQLWFMPATPILANGGTARGLPISCFLNETQDSLASIVDLWTENTWLSSKGGGIGSFWGHLRSIGDTLSNGGTSVGIIPFIKVMESLSLAIDQGSLRRGAAAAYLPISHPEIEEFMDMRKPTGGDYNRKALYLHHGVTIPNAFMECVEKDLPWNLISPQDGHVVNTVSARVLWIRLLTMRMETGEPYLLFVDHINDAIPEHHKQKNMHVKMSNLCTEITLPTGPDFHGKERTAVCCLSSVNLEKFLEWETHPKFIPDIMRFLDNVLSYFIKNAPPEMHRAVYAASQERSIGLGAMGFHAFLQSQKVPWESAVAKSWNTRIFKHIQDQAEASSIQLAQERGACPDAAACGIEQRFSNKIAIAPTASISIICGGTSPGIEPYVSNAYTHKTLSGSFFIRNTFLEQCLDEKGHNTDEIWSSILQNDGSVQHLDILSDYEKSIFKTAFEIDQKWVIDLAAERQPFICQAQSLNIFLASNVQKSVLHEIHYRAWKKKIKSCYYLRSRSIQRPESITSAKAIHATTPTEGLPLNYEECVSCQ
jgi:ribonucleoside-diphosphate reductase alpha chain